MQDTTQWPYIDLQCLHCRAFSHKHINCDKMAVYLLLMEASQNLNDKTKAKILETIRKQ